MKTMNDESEKKIEMAITYAASLGWVYKMNGKFYMQLEDVEKTILGVIDKDYGRTMERWARSAPGLDELPDLVQRGY